MAEFLLLNVELKSFRYTYVLRTLSVVGKSLTMAMYSYVHRSRIRTKYCCQTFIYLHERNMYLSYSVTGQSPSLLLIPYRLSGIMRYALTMTVNSQSDN
jgi:hypothetical protein